MGFYLITRATFMFSDHLVSCNVKKYVKVYKARVLYTIYSFFSQDCYTVKPARKRKFSNVSCFTIGGKCSTCSEECFSLARLNLIRQSCVVLRETLVQLGKSFRGGATTPQLRAANIAWIVCRDNGKRQHTLKVKIRARKYK